MHSPVQAQTRRAVSAAVIGNVLEWYDFSVYAFVAVIIARKFFPQGDDVIALLATFLAFGLGFVARPLGGIILGRVGDTHGATQQIFGEGLSFAKGRAQEIPGPQTKHGGKSMFVKPAFPAQL